MLSSSDNTRWKHLPIIRRKRSTDLKVKIDEARQLGLNNDYTDQLIERYKQRSLYELTGLDLKLSEQEIILRNEELKNYSDREIRRMTPYFRFSGNQVVIGTTVMQTVIALGIPVIFLGIAAVYFYESETGFAYDYWFPLSMGIVHGMAAMLSYLRITIPFLLAKRLKKRLNSSRKTTVHEIYE